MRRNNFEVVVYLDDFLLICQTYDECQNTQNSLIQLLVPLGLRVNWSTGVRLNQQVSFLGFILDSLNTRIQGRVWGGAEVPGPLRGQQDM